MGRTSFKVVLISSKNKVDLFHLGNSLDKLRHPRTVAYSELVLLNKHQISGGGAYLDCYPILYN